MIEGNKSRMNKKAIIFSIAVSLLVIVALFIFPAIPKQATAQTANDNDGEVIGWMWSSNIGWIRADSNNTNPLKVIDDQWQGYAWSPSLGWIDFNPTITIRDTYPSEPRHGVQTEGSDITGWARFCSVFKAGCSGDHRDSAERGGWDGWIKMVNVTRDSTTGGLSGYAWGDLNIGWLNFGSRHPINPCSLSMVDTNCDGTLNCDPCSQTCLVDCGGGGGPTVGCTVEPDSGSIGDNFTWYVSSLSGFDGDPEDFTYSWDDNDSGEGPTGSGDWNASLSRNQVIVSYSSLGPKTGSVTVSDENGHEATDGSCSNGVGDGIIIIDGGPSVCQVDINTEDYYGIELTFGGFPPLYDGVPRSGVNQLITLTDCSGLSITTTDLPPNVGLICSPDENDWDGCNNLSGGDYYIGVTSEQRDSGCQNIKLIIDEVSEITRVCFRNTGIN